jgi:hypothetical protein
MTRHAEVQQPSFQSDFYGVPGWFDISHLCGSTPTSNGSLLVVSRTSASTPKFDLFIDDGSTNPRYVQMDPFGTGNDTAGGPTFPGGELYILTAHHPDGRVATAFVWTVRRANDCVFQLQLTVTNTETD